MMRCIIECVDDARMCVMMRCSMGLFMFTVVLSLAIHSLAVLPLLYFLLTRRNPYTFMRSMSQVHATCMRDV